LPDDPCPNSLVVPSIQSHQLFISFLSVAYHLICANLLDNSMARSADTTYYRFESHIPSITKGSNMFQHLSKILLLCLLTLCFSSNGNAEQSPSPKITFTKINDQFWVLHGGNGLGANVGMSIGKDGILLVDAMNINSGKLLIEAIRTISDKPIKFVINTHQHGDHRGGNEELVKIGATVVYPDYLKYASGPSTRYQGAEREIQFTDRMSIKFNDDIFDLYHIKSHTWNDVIVKVREQNILFTGDNHATSWGPNIGVRGKRSVADVFDLSLSLSDDKTLVVPGHTELADRKHLIAYEQKVQQWFNYILSESSSGKSAQEIAKTKPVTAMMEWFHGGSYPDWLTEERLIARVGYTVFAQEKNPLELTEKELQPYLGFYQLDDGSQVELFNKGDELYAFKSETLTAFLLPRSKSQFDFSGWNEQEKFDFEFDKNDQATKLTFSVNGKVEFTAKRIAR
jgi:glyoxylase-like metal-dependent hydrolase (beta-lactamase superfamily II)